MKFKKFYIDRWTFKFRAGMARRILHLGYHSSTVQSEHQYWYCNEAGMWRSTANIYLVAGQDCKQLSEADFWNLSKEDIYETEGAITKVSVDCGDRSGPKSEIIVYDEVDDFKSVKDKSSLHPIFKEYCIYIHEIESINIGGEKPYVNWGFKMPNSGYKLVEHANKLGYNISRDEVCFSNKVQNVTVMLNADGNVCFNWGQLIKFGLHASDFYKGRYPNRISLQDFLKLTPQDVFAGYKAKIPPWGKPVWMSLFQWYKKYADTQFIQEYLGKPYSYNEENNKKENEKKMMFNNEVRVKLSPIEVGTKELDEKGNVLSIKDRQTFSVASIADAVHEYLTEHKDLKATNLAVCKLAETWYEVE